MPDITTCGMGEGRIGIELERASGGSLAPPADAAIALADRTAREVSP